jgi:hypothetical protein
MRDVGGRGEADRMLVRRALQVVQGHPKLLELADAAAREGRGVLEARVSAAEGEAAGRGWALTAFFAAGDGGLDADGFFGVLTGWVAQAVRGLSGPAGLLLELLCCAEDADRVQEVVEAVWVGVWRRLGREGDPPGVGEALGELGRAALVAVEPPAGAGGDAGPVVLRVHPGVAESVRAGADAAVRDAVDAGLAAFWQAAFGVGLGRDGGEDGRLVTRAGLSAAPYLLRLHAWDGAGYLLERAYVRSPGDPGTVQAVLPLLRRVAEATGTPAALGVYGRVLGEVDAAGGESVLRDTLDRAVAAADFHTASTAAGELVGLLAGGGRLAEALNMAEVKAGHSRRAGLGPWAQAADEAQRLQVLYRLGDAGRVLAEAEALLARLGTLPGAARTAGTVDPWGVREGVLQTGAAAARDLGRWEQALAYTDQVRTSMRARGAGDREIAAAARFGDYWPLLRLGRLAEVDGLLADCRRVFSDAEDAGLLGRVFSARAALAAQRGRHAEAARLEQIALRLGYTRPDPESLAPSHHNLAVYLDRAGSGGEPVLAHRLAAALLHRLTRAAGANHARAMRELADDLARDPAVDPPATVDAVADAVDHVEGVAWGALVNTLLAAHGLDRPAADATLTEIVHAARALAAECACPRPRAAIDATPSEENHRGVPTE